MKLAALRIRKPPVGDLAGGLRPSEVEIGTRLLDLERPRPALR